MIKNVVFDLGGVLVGLDLAKCRAAFDAIGLQAIGTLIDPCHPAAMMERMEQGDLTFHETYDEMRRMTGNRTVTDEQIAAAISAFLTGIAVEKLRAIEALRRRGIRTYVLSNNNPAAMETIRRMFTADGRTMEDYFDGIYLSYRMRCLKPHAEIFIKMLEDSNIRPEETLFIDDSERNVATARRLGFDVYQAAPDEDFCPLLDGIGR
ncbi:MAG: HAD family phosphatase [Alistipes senegalensis]|nr:HAD family phosphatase [Bacteroides cellulosilyticus]MCM1353012.1 HAD family phosphatase [Alistipes senegalensis]